MKQVAAPPQIQPKFPEPLGGNTQRRCHGLSVKPQRSVEVGAVFFKHPAHRIIAACSAASCDVLLIGSHPGTGYFTASHPFPSMVHTPINRKPLPWTKTCTNAYPSIIKNITADTDSNYCGNLLQPRMQECQAHVEGSNPWI